MAKAGYEWYAIIYPIPRTGRKEISYVYSNSRQAAVNTDLGASLLGGPYKTAEAAEAAFPQGSHGSIRPPPGVNKLKNEELSTQPSSFSISNWFTGIGADIGSGIESGIVALLKDIWHVIEGPLLVIVGVIILIVVLAIFFKDDIAAGVSMAAVAAA